MTAGQIAPPFRQIRAPLLVAALAVTFGTGLLAGLAVPRTVGYATQGATNAGVDTAAALTGSGTWADRLRFLHQQRELQAADTVGTTAASTGRESSAGLPKSLRMRY